MRSGALAYLWLVIKTASRHSFHATHSVILAVIIVAGIITSLVPQVEVLVAQRNHSAGVTRPDSLEMKMIRPQFRSSMPGK
jgi:hypothetical protein